jgi:undecaprenyl-diphosphatase
VSTIDALKLEAGRRRCTILVVAWLGMVGIAAAVGSQMPGATAVDHRISDWFADHRVTALDKLTAVFSDLASTFVVVGIAIVVIGVGAALRRRGGIAVIVIAMVGEVTMFLTITLLVDRARPDVPPLDAAPPTSSFPSGHVFATFVLWNAIAVVAVRQDWPSLVRRATRFAAVAMPAAVGLSRVYRGMHHPTDVIAALSLGMVWTFVVVLVVVPGEPRSDVAGSERLQQPQSTPRALRPVDHPASTSR